MTDRRTFLRGVEGLIALGATGATPRAAPGYGPLQPRPSQNTGETLLALPEGFVYTALGPAGSRLSDGNVTPGRHDGMAAFRIDGKIRLLRNHEVTDPVGRKGAAIAKGRRVYDATAGAGVTTLVLDPKTRTLEKAFVALAGTFHNCAGGPTPWGSWLSCEESILGATQGVNEKGETIGGFDKEHGYVFEVPAAADSLVEAKPLKAMGRFVHEAVAIDPTTGVVYLTEDRSQAGFYRFIPHRPGELASGGKLQMLAIDGKPGYDTRKGQKPLAPMPCLWVNIPDPDPPGAATNDRAVFAQGAAQGAATFARLEGCWQGDGNIYLNATTGGDAGIGQVWRYRPLGDRGELTLLFESRDPNVLQNPDNLCVAPRGTLLLCEDADGVCFLRALTPRGEIFDLARCASAKHPHSEFAGACFSPDGATLFVNLQDVGVTVAIWGPWSHHTH